MYKWTKGKGEEKEDERCQQNFGRWIAGRQAVTDSAGERKLKSEATEGKAKKLASQHCKTPKRPVIKGPGTTAHKSEAWE